jgi:nicotinate-nucleotide adenylyltransferase
MKIKISNIKTIAVFGGSFNPLHNGHIEIIKVLSKKFDMVLVLPTSQTAPTATAAMKAFTNEMIKHRLKMIELAISELNLSNVFIDTLEIDKGGVSYTIDTMHELTKRESETNNENKDIKKKKSKFSFVIGLDNLQSLPSWDGYEELIKLTDFIVFNRGDKSYDIKSITPKTGNFTILKDKITSISSTQIRNAVKDNDVNGLLKYLPKCLVDYIFENGLYKS